MASLFSPYFSSNEDASAMSGNNNSTSSFVNTYASNNSNINVYDDLDALESGDAREFIPYDFLIPSKDWTLCKVYRKSAFEFVMVLEPTDGKISSEKFMLSAKRVENDFYISQYESFPNEGDKEAIPASRYCAVLRASTHSVHKKQITWELVPACLGTNSTSDGDIFMGASMATLPLTSITRGCFRQPTSGNDIACVDIKLPRCSGEGNGGRFDSSSLSRGGGDHLFDSDSDEDERILHEMNVNGGRGNLYVWDRTARRSKPVSKLSRYSKSANDLTTLTQRSLSASTSTTSITSLETASSSSSSNCSSRTTSPISAHHRCISDGSGSVDKNKNNESSVNRLPVSIASQIPIWDSHRGTFMMKFLRNRIKVSSAKNFVFYHSDKVRGGKQASTTSWKSGCEVSCKDAVLQFGKYEHNCYTLDFRRPVAPLHAFALALSTFPGAAL